MRFDYMGVHQVLRIWLKQHREMKLWLRKNCNINQFYPATHKISPVLYGTIIAGVSHLAFACALLPGAKKMVRFCVFQEFLEKTEKCEIFIYMWRGYKIISIKNLILRMKRKKNPLKG